MSDAEGLQTCLPNSLSFRKQTKKKDASLRPCFSDLHTTVSQQKTNMNFPIQISGAFQANLIKSVVLLIMLKCRVLQFLKTF